MGIPIGNQKIAFVMGAAWKVTVCEKCGCEYVYKIVRTGTGTGFNPMWLDSDGAEDRASGSASKRSEKKLRKEVDPVPCIDCGWYQAAMVRKLKLTRWKWTESVKNVGIVILIVVGVISLLGALIGEIKNLNFLVDSPAGFFILIGALLAAAPNLTGTFYDPNKGYELRRGKNSSGQPVFRKADLERLVSETDTTLVIWPEGAKP